MTSVESCMIAQVSPPVDGPSCLDQPQATGMPHGKVLFLRNLPKTVTEHDLVALLHPYSKGATPLVYVQAARGQGFAEFTTEDAAAECLRQFQMNNVQLGGNSIHATYSTRSHVVTHEQHISRTENASRVLLVHVVNLLYPVTIELLHQIFSRFGIVERIVTFQKETAVFQAFVQFVTVDHATGALRQLDNQNIYTGCNLLRIQYSQFQELNVRYNNTRSRDYTNPNLPTGPDMVQPVFEGGLDFSSPMIAMSGPMFDNSLPGMTDKASLSSHQGPESQSRLKTVYPLLHGCPSTPMTPMTSARSPGGQQVVLICYKLVPGALSVDELFNLFSFYGYVIRIKIMHTKNDTALIQYAEPEFASVALQHLEGAVLNGQEIHLDYAKAKEVTFPSTPRNSAGVDVETPSAGSTLPPTPDHEGAAPQIDTSKYKQFTLKDRRYGTADAKDKILRSACKPTQLLHVANLPLEATEEEVSAMFSQEAPCTSVRFLPPVNVPNRLAQTKMALVTYTSVEAATMALVRLHNSPLRERKLKVSFSKAPPC